MQEPAFPGDGNELLRAIQDGEERLVLAAFAAGAARRLVLAARVLRQPLEARVHPEFASQLVRENSVRLELTHAVLAAAYRQRHPELGQLVLGFEARQQRGRLVRDWLVWARASLDALLDDGEVCVPVLQAVLHAGQARGYRAERRVAALLVRKLYRQLPASDLGWPLGAAADLARRTTHVWNGNPLAPLFALTAPG